MVFASLCLVLVVVGDTSRCDVVFAGHTKRGGPTEHGIICLNRITDSIFLSKLTGIMLIC